jgi:outer membrane protein assembly factor BamD (BamD/ComL family)
MVRTLRSSSIRPQRNISFSGMRQYAQKDFRPALHSFRASIGGHPLSHRITAAKVMEAKTLYALKNYPEASLACDSILAQFPMTMYREDILFTRGMCLYNLGDHPMTFAEMVQTFIDRSGTAEQRTLLQSDGEYRDRNIFSVQQVEERIAYRYIVCEIRNMLSGRAGRKVCF